MWMLGGGGQIQFWNTAKTKMQFTSAEVGRILGIPQEERYIILKVKDYHYTFYWTHLQNFVMNMWRLTFFCLLSSIIIYI